MMLMKTASLVLLGGMLFGAADASACPHCRERERQDEARRQKLDRDRRPARVCGKTIIARSSVNTVGNPCETTASFRESLKGGRRPAG